MPVQKLPCVKLIHVVHRRQKKIGTQYYFRRQYLAESTHQNVNTFVHVQKGIKQKKADICSRTDNNVRRTDSECTKSFLGHWELFLVAMAELMRIGFNIEREAISEHR